MNDAQSGDFPWDVELPERTRRGMGAPKPQATLVYGEERRRLPVALSLGRVLLRERGTTFDPQSAPELLDAVHEREAALAWEWLVAALNRRDLTRDEARERLRREGYGPGSIDSAVNRAVESRFIDDLRYADTFTRQRKAMGWGRARIERELARRGVRVADVDGWSEAHFDSGDEAERAREVLLRRSVPERNPYEKLVRFLVARGFDYAVAKAAAAERIDGDGEDD